MATVLGGAIVAVLGGTAMAMASGPTGAEASQEASFTAAHRPQATVAGDQALTIALARHAGTATDMHLQDEGDGLRWEVKPTDGRTVWEVQIDARTGAVVGDQADE